MKTLVGGAIAALFGFVFLSIWWKPFLHLLAGSIPVLLLLGGGLALYLGFDELKDTWKREETQADSPAQEENDVEKYKAEIDDLKKEIDALKKA